MYTELMFLLSSCEKVPMLIDELKLLEFDQFYRLSDILESSSYMGIITSDEQ